ncbi:MAG: peptide chain release factor 2 [Coriobacteriales bacterium]|jgi:peptide chain release factor 2|nr:peptide chain release factor 2 [Coriobacteriales bacterium]
MTEALTESLLLLRERLKAVGDYLRLPDKQRQLAQLEDAQAQPGFWDDSAQAQSVSRLAAELRRELTDFEKARTLLAETAAANELIQLAATEGESEADIAELEAEARRLLTAAEASLDEIELDSWFSGEYDHGDAIVSVNPGQGGLEAQDWAQMLFKMYLRYAVRRGWQVEVLDAPSGEVIGIDNATFIVSGRNAYGMLRAERGTHRLVRISPTDDKKRRQTTFAGVEVLPVLPEDAPVEVKNEDIRVDVYRSSGPGGQSVNTTDSAVRITHLPTGLVVTCQNEKSQLQNRESALKILRSRLFELERQRREQELARVRGEKTEASWGNQIRNYVLYPYQLIKDVRSNVETGNVSAVLEEGDLDPFILAYQRWQMEQGKAFQGQEKRQDQGKKQ